ncbi:hypothetical protein CR513_25734, partial [Mucuna pruriens]
MILNYTWSGREMLNMCLILNYLKEKKKWRKVYSYMEGYEVCNEKKICIKIRANVEEDREATIARFIKGLKKEIADVSKSSSKFSASSSSSWRSNWKNSTAVTNSKEDVIAKYSNAPPKGKIDTDTSYRSHDIKCFKCQGVEHIASQCPNKRAMIMMDDGEVESESPSDDEISPLEDCSDMEVVEPVYGVVLVTRCLVQGKVCNMILDGGSCTNVASTILVEKINLQTAKHPRPYKLQCLSNIGEVKVDKQVSVPFAIENYKDEVLFDVVLMEAGHILSKLRSSVREAPGIKARIVYAKGLKKEKKETSAGEQKKNKRSNQKP